MFNNAHYFEFFSTVRYWLLLLLTLVLNIIFIVYFVPNDDVRKICPHFFLFANGTLSPDPDLPHDYVIGNFVIGSLYAFLVVWMLLEYFIITWPHFVLPKFLYNCKKYCENHPAISWLSRYEYLYTMIAIDVAMLMFSGLYCCLRSSEHILVSTFLE